jgi:hypothetical protein
MTIPRQIVPGLDDVPASALGGISVSPAGDALSWPSLDVDVYVPGLVERAFGTRLFARATGQRGGQRRSKAKTAAASEWCEGRTSTQALTRIGLLVSRPDKKPLKWAFFIVRPELVDVGRHRHK